MSYIIIILPYINTAPAGNGLTSLLVGTCPRTKAHSSGIPVAKKESVPAFHFQEKKRTVQAILLSGKGYQPPASLRRTFYDMFVDRRSVPADHAGRAQYSSVSSLQISEVCPPVMQKVFRLRFTAQLASYLPLP